MPTVESVPAGSPPRAVWKACGIDALAYHAVLLHLLRGSERPQAAAAVWSALILHTDSTGTVTAKRADIARTAMCSPADASRVLTDLVQLGVIARDGEGRASRYRLLREAATTPAALTSASPYQWPGVDFSKTRTVTVAVTKPATEPGEMRTVYAKVVEPETEREK